MSNKLKYECNEDCFNCKWPDCIKDGITPKERREQNSYDERLNDGGSGAHIIHRSTRRRRRRS